MDECKPLPEPWPGPGPPSLRRCRSAAPPAPRAGHPIQVTKPPKCGHCTTQVRSLRHPKQVFAPPKCGHCTTPQLPRQLHVCICEVSGRVPCPLQVVGGGNTVRVQHRDQVRWCLLPSGLQRVGPRGYCSPRQSMPCNSSYIGHTCVSMTWRALVLCICSPRHPAHFEYCSLELNGTR